MRYITPDKLEQLQVALSSINKYQLARAIEEKTNAKHFTVMSRIKQIKNGRIKNAGHFYEIYDEIFNDK